MPVLLILVVVGLAQALVFVVLGFVIDCLRRLVLIRVSVIFVCIIIAVLF